MSEELPNPKRPKLEESNGAEELHQYHTVPTTMSARLLVKKLSEHATLPVRASARAAGYDLFAAHDTTIEARGKALVKTDISLAIPVGHYGRIAPRSSLAWKNHIDVGAGVIDEDYRGPLGVVLFNHGAEAFESTAQIASIGDYNSRVEFDPSRANVKRGDRVAQLIIEVIAHPEVEEVTDLDNTERGQGGFGSTGTNTVQVNTAPAPSLA